MARNATKAVADPFAPIVSEADWEEQGWAAESEPLTAASRLEARITIHLDPDSAAVLRRAARLSGMTMSELVRRAALQEAAELIKRAETSAGRPTSADG